MGRVERGDTALGDRLDDLKTSGSALLVVGDVPDDCYARVSRRMLGDTTSHPRRHALVVNSPPSPGLSRRLPETTDAERTPIRVITYGSPVRSAVQASGGSARPTTPTHVDPGDLEDLGCAVLDAIDSLDGDDLEPATLRLAFDTLQSLVDTADDFDVFALVDLLAHRVRAANAIAHFRLPKPRDTYYVDLFQPLFDAVVELRVNGDDVEQQWEFPDDGFTSKWMSVE